MNQGHVPGLWQGNSLPLLCICSRFGGTSIRKCRELRKRKLSEDKVADVLRELQSHLQDTGARPEEAFGGPKDYAARFPEGSTVAPGSKLGYLAAGYMAMTLLLTGVLIGWSNGRLKKTSPSHDGRAQRQQ
ncbi:hypothetical protein QFZ79_003128 [Arthrobacter sp. V4I6]|nr:hypothetical protein [Arthrobacter sp. V1I7]MDQ0855017.1 hypothetical protein [Arthrobacter sp. V4I6]